MTREEAIKNLVAYAYYVDEPMPEEVAKSFDMAIEALQAEYEDYEHATDVVREHIDVIEVILCKDCKHLDVWNLKNIYAVCSKHGITFEPFEDDTRTCFCSWGERREP